MPRPKNELTRAETLALLGKKPAEEKKSKYNNKKTPVTTFFGEHLFDSKAEAAHYRLLLAQHLNGEISRFFVQVPLRLPGKSKYVADFLVIHKDGFVELIDVKGVRTAMYKLKKRQVREIYGLDITEVS